MLRLDVNLLIAGFWPFLQSWSVNFFASVSSQRQQISKKAKVEDRKSTQLYWSSYETTILKEVYSMLEKMSSFP